MSYEYFSLGQFLIRRRFGATGKPSFCHWCPACAELHDINDEQWKFNGDTEKPSFDPAVIFDNGARRCHYRIKAGMIEYDADSTHSLRGKTTKMSAVPERATRYMRRVR